MYLKYGTYTHEIDEAAVVISQTAVFNDAQVPTGILERWDISGRLMSSSTSALTTDIRNLKEAYSTDGENIVLLLNDGTTESAHKMVSSQAVGGVRVVERPSFPVGDGPQYVQLRDYRIVLEAEFPSGQAGSGLLSYVETIQFRGGGPRFVVQETRNGPPVKSLVSQQTPYFASQSGSAIGYLGYPTIPLPLWPGAEDRPEREREYITPKATGGGNSRVFNSFEVRWRYSFVDPGPLNGRPTPRPRNG